MQNCTLKITTTVDGETSEIVRGGKMELSACGAKLCYREENAVICMEFDGETVRIDRQGDYALRLLLRQNCLETGVLGLGGAQGEVKTFTHKIAYATAENGLTAQLHYNLLFGEEKQVMQLRILAKFV